MQQARMGSHGRRLPKVPERRDMTIETVKQLRAEIAYRINERIGIMTLGAPPSKSVVEFATIAAYEWAAKNYPELYKSYVQNNTSPTQAKAQANASRDDAFFGYVQAG